MGSDIAKRQMPAMRSHNTLSGTSCGSACDQCHRRKERCSGRTPCDRCISSKNLCTYSLGRPLGKPKGRRNNVNSRNPSRPVQQSPVSPLAGCITEKVVELDMRSETINFGGMPDNKRPPLATNSSIIPLGVFNEDTQGPFDLDFGYGSETSLLSSHDIAKTTSELWNLAPALSMAGSVDENSLPPKILTSPQTVQAWSGLSVSATTTINRSAPDTLSHDFPFKIMAALYHQQKSISWSPVNETLPVAREGLDVVSKYVSDMSSPKTSASLSSTIIIASFLILQQALACYMELHAQAAAKGAGGKDGEVDMEILYIGEFQIRGSESCKNVLEALVKAEIARGRVILTRLQQVAEALHSAGDDRTGLFELAFRWGSLS